MDEVFKQDTKRWSNTSKMEKRQKVHLLPDAAHEKHYVILLHLKKNGPIEGLDSLDPRDGSLTV